MATAEALARKAQGLLSDADFMALLATLKNDTLREWANTPSADMTRREEHYRDIQALGRLENRLKALVDNLKVDAKKAQNVSARERT
jgi:hypothetical protein